jgi:hypothetical protein
MSLSNIRDQIKAKIESVSGTGKIIHGIVFLRSQAEIDFVSSGNIINAVGFIQINKDDQTAETEESFDIELNERIFVFVYYYQWNDNINQDTLNSFETVEDYSENLIEAFNSDMTINDSIEYHDKLKLTSNQIVTTFQNKLVHILTFELKVYEISEQN